MTRLRGWALRGQKLLAKVPQGRWRTLTFLAALISMPPAVSMVRSMAPAF